MAPRQRTQTTACLFFLQLRSRPLLRIHLRIRAPPTSPAFRKSPTNSVVPKLAAEPQPFRPQPLSAMSPRAEHWTPHRASSYSLPDAPSCLPTSSEAARHL